MLLSISGMDVPGTLGNHDRNFSGIPYDFVFTDLVAQIAVGQ